MKSLVEKIFSNGYLLHFRTSRWACECSLPLEAIGLPKENVPQDFKLSFQLHLPKKIKNLLNTYTTRMKYVYIRYGLPFFIHNVRFITSEAIEDFFKEIRPLIEKYYTLKEDIIKNYPTYKFESRREFLSTAKNAYSIYKKIEPFPVDENTFINNYIDKMSNYYPSIDEIDKALQIKYVFFKLSYPSDFPPLYSSLVQDNINTNLKEFVKNSVILLRGSLKSHLYKLIDPFNLNRTLPPEIIYSKIKKQGFKNEVEAIFKLNFFKDPVIEDVKHFYYDFLLSHKPKDFTNSILRFNLDSRIKNFIKELVNPASAKETIEKYLS